MFVRFRLKSCYFDADSVRLKLFIQTRVLREIQYNGTYVKLGDEM